MIEVAEHAFERGADAQQRGAGGEVPGMRLELDPLRAQGLERVRQLEQLRLAIRTGPLE